MILHFALVDRYSRTLTQGAIDKAEKAGKPTGLVPASYTEVPEIEGPVEEPAREKKTRGKSKKQQDAEELFERLWRMYPTQRNKFRVSDDAKLRLLAAGEDKCAAAVDRYKREVAGYTNGFGAMAGPRFFNEAIFEIMSEMDVRPAPAQERVTPDSVNATIMKQGIYDRQAQAWDRARFEEVKAKLSPEMAAAIEAKMG